MAELHIDRAYLSSTLGAGPAADLAIYCKAWPVRTGAHFAKTAFTLDWERQTHPLPQCCRDALSSPAACVHFPASDLRRLPAAGALHGECGRAQRERFIPTSACCKNCASAS